MNDGSLGLDDDGNAVAVAIDKPVKWYGCARLSVVEEYPALDAYGLSGFNKQIFGADEQVSGLPG
jgi:hypothetical protein